MKEFTLEGEIGWSVGTYEVRNVLRQAGGEDIKVNWASPGGSVITGIKIFNLFKRYEGNVDFHFVGEAASMGSYIPLAGRSITAEPNSVFMIHNARNFIGGDHNEMRKMADIVEGFSNLIRDEYVRRTGKTKAEITKMMDAETFFFGQEMVDAGFVDEITGEPDTDPDARQTHVAVAKESFEACMKKVRDDKPDDYEQAAAILSEFAAKKPDTVVVSGDNDTPRSDGGKQKELKTMDLLTLKAQHPDLCEQLKAEGVAEERDRVSAHLIYGEACGDMKTACEAVKNGTGMTETIKAQYAVAARNKQDVDARQGDEEIAADGADGVADETETKGDADAVLALVKDLTGYEEGK